MCLGNVNRSVGCSCELASDQHGITVAVDYLSCFQVSNENCERTNHVSGGVQVSMVRMCVHVGLRCGSVVQVANTNMQRDPFTTTLPLLHVYWDTFFRNVMVRTTLHWQACAAGETHVRAEHHSSCKCCMVCRMFQQQENRPPTQPCVQRNFTFFLKAESN